MYNAYKNNDNYNDIDDDEWYNINQILFYPLLIIMLYYHYYCIS